MKIFITGGTTGIGLELAKLYLMEGHDVAICGRDLSKLPPSFAQSYEKLKTYELDVLDLNKMKETVKEFAPEGLDIVVANAGVALSSKTEIPDFNLGRKVIEINVIGVMNTFEVALELMIPNKSGHLVAVGSVAGMAGLPGAGAYSASKAAVLTLCESYSLTLKKFGIDVTAIAPGFIDTPITQKNPHPMPFMLSAEDGAREIKFAIEAKKPLHIFPLPMFLIMFTLSRLPRFMYRALMNLKLFNYSKKN